MNNLEWAKYYLKQGFSVIPIGKNKEGQHGLKAPLILTWKEYQTKLPTEEEVIKWWMECPEAKIGIITGKASQLVVVDIDKPVEFHSMGIHLTETLKVKTGKGLHFYYKYPKDKKVSGEKIKNGEIEVGDIKAEGGYVIAPPSEHHNDKDQIDGQYEWIDMIGEKPIAEYDFPLDKIKSTQSASTGIKFEKLMTGVQSSGRNSSATVFIGALLKKFAQPDWISKVWPACLEWNKMNNPPMSEEELEGVFKSICKKEISATMESNQANLDATEKYKSKFHPISSNELRKKTPEPFPYLLKGLIPERAITVIAGKTGCGKSLFCLYIADGISRGDKVFEQLETKKSRALYMDFEMNEEDYIYRTIILCHEENDLIISYGARWKAEEEIQVAVLKEYIKENEINLIVFDTLSKIHRGDENSSTDITKVMEFLLDMIEELQITIILIHHHNKGKDNEGMYKGRGSTAIPDNCASYLEVQSKMIKDEVGADILAMDIEQHKKRRSGISKFGLNIQFKENEQAIFQYREETIQAQDELTKVKPIVLEYVRDNPGLSKNKIELALSELYHFKRNTIRDALDVLVRLNQLIMLKGERRSKVFFLKDDNFNPEQFNF